MSEEITGWFAGRLPDGWFVEPPEVIVDREEITVIGTIPPVEDAAVVGRVKRFREETREQRMAIADEAELRFGRKVAWGVRAGRWNSVPGSRSKVRHPARRPPRPRRSSSSSGVPGRTRGPMVTVRRPSSWSQNASTSPS